MPIAGLRGTGDWGDGERLKNFRESIMWMAPNGETPLLGLSSKASGKKRTVDDPEFSWWNEPMDLIRLQVAGALGSADSLVVVDSGDPTASAIKSNYGKATHLVPGDVLMVEPTTDSVTDDYERVIVNQVHSETAFSVTRGAMGTTPANIGDNVYLLKIGSVFAEGTSAPQSTSRNPIKFTNFTQIFKTTYEITGTALKTKTRTGDVLANDKRRRAFDHAKDIEMAMLFGKKSESTDPTTGKPMRTMGGIRSFIPTANTTILGDNWSLANPTTSGNSLIDAISPVFDYASPAGDTRIAFVGNGALNRINSAILKSSGASGVHIEWGLDKTVWGMNFHELIFPQGKVMLKTHPMLSRHSMYTNSMWLLDFSAISYVPMKGRDTDPKDNIQTDDEDLQRGQWLTECSVMVDYAGQTLGYIGGFDSAIA